MGNDFIYVTKAGLRVIYVEKKNFHKSYAGIGLNYGSRDLEYYVKDTLVQSKEGTAHFIEHQLFQMPYGDAFKEFSKWNASANAYTDLEKTLYFFSTSEDVYQPLRLLLEMYFTPYFIEEEVEREKGIIASEIQMYEDIVQSKVSQKIISALYPKMSLSSPVAGTKKSISEIKAQDLYQAYEAFYTVDNSILVLVSHEPRDKVYSFIEEVLSTLNLNRGLPKTLAKISAHTGKDFTYATRVEQTTASLAIRFTATQEQTLFCNYIIGILDSILSPVAAFYKKLYKENAFFADIEYYVMTLRDTSYAVISTTSNQPELFLECVQNKLQHLTKKDLNSKIIDFYIKHLKAKGIRALDSIEELGEEILILALENASYMQVLEESQNMKLADFASYLKDFQSAKYVKAICKKSTKSKKK